MQRGGAGVGEPAARERLRNHPEKSKPGENKTAQKIWEELATERDREVLAQELREGGKQKISGGGEGNEGLSQEKHKRVSGSLF